MTGGDRPGSHRRRAAALAPLKRGLLACILLLQGPAQAGFLLDLYERALAQDPRWAAARANREAKAEKPIQGYARLLPTLSLRGSLMSYDSHIEYGGESRVSNADRNYQDGQYGLNLTHPLYRRQDYALYQQSLIEGTIGDLQLAGAREDLIMRVAEAYFGLVSAMEDAELAAGEVATYATHLAHAKERLAAGASPITDVHEARTRLDTARSREIAARAEMQTRIEAMHRLVHDAPDWVPKLGTGFSPAMLEPDDANAWVEMAQANNKWLQSQREAVHAARWELDGARSARLPTLDLSADYGLSHVDGNALYDPDSRSKTLSVGVKLALPFSLGGWENSRVREAKANLDKAKHELEDKRREAAFAVQQAFIGVSRSLAQAQALDETVQSTEALLESTRRAFTVGLRTLSEVLDAEQRVFGAKRERSRARYDFLLQRLKLRAAAGVLSHDDLGEIDAMLADR